ncbi:terminase TerL endonuclease subunit [Facklamia sp. P12950]|uniref:terminase TerL endonuclease subunit n=1 Tax=Facklamia sp. P12950 TaxID=3421951 RepID=UPI003D1789B1
MISQVYIDQYIDTWKSGKILVNEEQELLFEWVHKRIYTRNDIYFDEDQIENCIKFIEKWYFKLEPFQKFLIAFVFLKYKGKKKVVFNQFFWTMARGAGKNGLISGLSHYLISDLHGVNGYNVGVVATSEDQAVTSVEETYNVIDEKEVLQVHFRHNLSKIISRNNKNWFKYYTSNADTKEGARLGAIIFDEIHEFMDSKIIGAFRMGFGKRPYSRTFFIGTTGFKRDGVYDELMKRSLDILHGKTEEFGFFPFVCRLDSIEEMNDFDYWQKANPMFQKPMSEYAEILFDEVITDYNDLKYGGDKGFFIVKRMNFDDIETKENVASKEDVKACNRELPDLTGYPGIGTLDLSSNKDFTACGVILREGPKYFYDTHSFVPRTFLNNYEISIPVDEWSKRDPITGREPLLTIVEEVDIPISYIVDWFVMKREKYNINTIIIDRYRKDYAEKALKEAGFEVIVVMKSQAIAAGIGIRIQSIFSRRLLSWGYNPLMNWFTNNVYVTRDKYNNLVFGKKGKERRKTDGFMAMMLGIWKSDDLIENEPEEFVLGDFYS